MINPQALETFGNYDKKSLMAGIVVGQGLKGRARAPRTPAPAGFPQELWDAAAQRANAMIASMQVEQQSPGTPEETTPDDWEFDKDAFCFGIAAGRSLEGWEIDGGVKFNRSIIYYIFLDSPCAIEIWLNGCTGNGENLFIDWGDSTDENSTNIDYANHHYINTNHRLYMRGSFYDIGYVTHNYENSGEYIVTIFSTDNIAPHEDFLADAFLGFGGVHEVGVGDDGYIPGTVIGGNVTGGSIVPSASSILRAAYFNDIDRLGGNAFHGLEGLSSVTFTPDTISDFMLGGRAFNSCICLQNINIPYGTTFLGNYAFAGCHSLTSIDIPNSVEYIGSDAFRACYSLESVVISNSTKHIMEYTFFRCKALTNVTIPDGVTSIGNDAFLDCSNLTSVTIPDSVTLIGSWAFRNCTSLTSVTIPDSVTSIGNDAFKNTRLTSVTINRNCSLGSNAFPSGCEINYYD